MNEQLGDVYLFASLHSDGKDLLIWNAIPVEGIDTFYNLIFTKTPESIIWEENDDQQIQSLVSTIDCGPVKPPKLDAPKWDDEITIKWLDGRTETMTVKKLSDLF